jgi:hypothetical protein
MDFLTVIKSTLISFVSGIVRTSIISGVSWLAARNLVDDSTSAQLVTWIPIVVAGIAWSLVEKYILAKFHLEKLLIALTLPANSTPAHLNTAIRQKRIEKKTGTLSSDWQPPEEQQ